MFRRLIVVLGVVVGLLAVAPPMPAAAACSGTGCNGVDSEKSGCASDARTVDSPDTGGWVTLELRYSPSCRAVWARVTNFRGVGGVVKVIGYTSSGLGREETRTLAAYTGEVKWTRMISSTYTTYACYRKFDSFWGWSEWCGRGL